MSKSDLYDRFGNKLESIEERIKNLEVEISNLNNLFQDGGFFFSPRQNVEKIINQMIESMKDVKKLGAEELLSLQGELKEIKDLKVRIENGEAE